MAGKTKIRVPGGNSKLRRIIKKYFGPERGAQVKFARRHKISTSYVNNVLTGRRVMGKKIERVLEAHYSNNG